ncbi:MAG: hypothetical protein RL284_1975 [Bacteroidota bacterium]|jgi:hypothetical protein
MSFLKELIPLYDRDLKALRREIESYPDDALVWKKTPGINNPGGNVFLHLMGNLNTFFGAVYANTGYVRNRPLEFSATGISRAKLVAMLDEIHPIVLQVLRDFPSEKLGEIYPIKIFDEEKTISYIFIHLETHLAYHLGQINYHRRILS